MKRTTASLGLAALVLTAGGGVFLSTSASASTSDRSSSSTVTRVDDSGRHSGIEKVHHHRHGRHHGLATSQRRGGTHVEPGDDRGVHAEPGDDRGGAAEPGDDRGDDGPNHT